MQKVKLIEHIKHGDTLYTPFNDPKGMGSLLSLSNWAHDWLPEFLWIGLIIDKKGRKQGLNILYKLLKELKEANVLVAHFSKIIKLDENNQKTFWSIVSKYVEDDVLSPLTVVVTPEINETFYNKYFKFMSRVEDHISILIDITKQCTDFHDSLTTDICFIVDWIYNLNGNLHISSELDLFSSALTEYHKHEHTDEVMRMYRPIIRSTFQGLCNLHGDKEFSKKFWKILGEVSECNPKVIIWEKVDSLEFYEQSTKVIDYISVSNEDKKMDTKFAVVMGMTCYIFRLYKEIINKQMQNDISGRILFRTMLETYINLKYLMLQEREVHDIYERFKAYGYGKYKLIMAKLREGKYSISKDTQIDQKYMEFLVNEEINETFISMSLGYFDKLTIRTKFQKCQENELYEIYYEYGTNYAHGFWGAIRESSMLFCDNPTHTYHTVPDFYGEQNARSVLSDCEMVMRKVFSAISEYIEMPDFYTDNEG